MVRSRRLLILSQVYVPDPASVGQHLHDVAKEMAHRGWDVHVICSSRGYDDPTHCYPKHEHRDGVTIRRYDLPLFSKTNMIVRVLGSAWAMLALFFLALFSGRIDVVLFSTSPPLVGLLGITVAALKQAKPVYWAMDLNPDQLVAMGKLSPRSLMYRGLERANKIILSRSRLTITLDRFMAERLHGNGRRPQQVLTIPPWPHESSVEPVAHADNSFRHEHGLDGKFVIMYSGNHSPANPLDTLLAAMEKLQDDDSLRFAFIGGGMDKPKVKKFIAERGLKNVLELPYQPLEKLRYSLSAADVHVVSLGEGMVGIIHPCKVYGAMTVGRPLLFLGPSPSHVDDLLQADDIGRSVKHGDVEGCVAAINALRALPAKHRESMGVTAKRVLDATLSERRLNGQFCDAIERLSTASEGSAAIAPPPRPPAPAIGRRA